MGLRSDWRKCRIRYLLVSDAGFANWDIRWRTSRLYSSAIIRPNPCCVYAMKTCVAMNDVDELSATSSLNRLMAFALSNFGPDGSRAVILWLMKYLKRTCAAIVFYYFNDWTPISILHSPICYSRIYGISWMRFVGSKQDNFVFSTTKPMCGEMNIFFFSFNFRARKKINIVATESSFQATHK